MVCPRNELIEATFPAVVSNVPLGACEPTFGGFAALWAVVVELVTAAGLVLWSVINAIKPVIAKPPTTVIAIPLRPGALRRSLTLVLACLWLFAGLPALFLMRDLGIMTLQIGFTSIVAQA